MENVIYLAGGCYWGVEKYISEIRGVLSTVVGFANGDFDAPTYQQVRYENTGHAETVKVTYDPETVPLTALLNLFYKIIDPRRSISRARTSAISTAPASILRALRMARPPESRF